jgi:hypothetical protein
MQVPLAVTLPQYFGAYIRESGNCVLKFYTCENNNISPYNSSFDFTFIENIKKRSIYINKPDNSYYDGYTLGIIGEFGDAKIILYIFSDSFINKYLRSNNMNIITVRDFDSDIIMGKIESLLMGDSNFQTTLTTQTRVSVPLTGCSTISTIPSYVIELIKQDAVKKQETCPILYDSLTMDNSVVTSCFHTFSKTGITQWLKNNSACPKCRQKCTVCA